MIPSRFCLGRSIPEKVLGNSGAKLKSAGSSLQEIELIRAEDGTISVKLSGYAKEEAARVGISTQFHTSTGGARPPPLRHSNSLAACSLRECRP